MSCVRGLYLPYSSHVASNSTTQRQDSLAKLNARFYKGDRCRGEGLSEEKTNNFVDPDQMDPK
jgi:hypothetical protein